MVESVDDIYACAPMRGLRHDQMRSLSADVQRCSGTHALLLTAAADEVAPSSPLLGCWITLRFSHRLYTGDVIASTDHALPFIDDAFQLVLMQHALEVVPAPAAVLEDALRTLAPGGVLVLTGLHPLSAWSPWFWWRGRRSTQRLRFPLGLRRILVGAGMEVERLSRVGKSWPGKSSRFAMSDHIFGGGYVLVARKRRHNITRLRLSRISAPLTSQARLSAETRRSASSDA